MAKAKAKAKRKSTAKRKPAPSRKPATKSTKKTAKSEARNLELEAQIAANPDDDAIRRVYADWLQEAGNPRGEVAALQLAGKDDEAEALIEAHGEQLLGKAVHGYRLDGVTSQLTWRGGFFDEVQLSTDDIGRLAACPSAALMRSLAIDGGPHFEAAIDALASLKSLPALRALTIGDYAEGQSAGVEEPRRSCKNLAKLAALAPNLERLTVRCADYSVGDFAALRSFTSEGSCLRRHSLQSLLAAKLPKLEEVAILIADFLGDGPLEVTAKDLAPLYKRKTRTTLYVLVDELRDELESTANVVVTDEYEPDF